MYYAWVRAVGHGEAVQLIEAELGRRQMSRLDLVRKIGYPLVVKGLAELEQFFAGKDCSNKLRMKIGRALDIDHEELTGERGFEDEEEYLKFIFKPHLLRVPEHTRPSQITIFGMLGFGAVFIAAEFGEWSTSSPVERQAKIRQAILGDMSKRQEVTLFGKILGYAFYSEYDKPAIAYSREGEELPGMEITYGGYATSNVALRNKPISKSGWFRIPRLTAVEIKEHCGTVCT